MNELHSEEPATTVAKQEPQEMSTRTLIRLNGSLLLLLVVLGVLLNSAGSWGAAFLIVALIPLIAFWANIIMFFKAIWRKQYQLAILYLICAVLVAVFFNYVASNAPGKIGG